MEIPFLVLVIVLGACFGSFANVIIYRWPRQESFISPRSRCPKCSSPIKFYQNIPVISWVLLRGQCAQCKNKISFMYPFVELLTATIFGLIFLTSGLSLTTLNMLVFTIFAIPCFFIDLKHMYLPDVMTLPGLALALIISIFNVQPNFTDAFLGALLGGLGLWFLAYVYKKWRGVDGMGGGDIKLLAWLGALFGYQSVTFILFASSVAGTLIGTYFLIFKNKDSKTFAIPFGPFLIVGGYLFYFIK